MTQKREWTVAPDTPLQFLKGVGEARAGLFAAAGLETVVDLLHFFPHRYEDRRHPIAIRDLGRIDAPVTIRGRIVSASGKVSPVRRLKIFEAILDDGTGTVMLVWFNQPYLADKIHRNDQLVVYGQPRMSRRLQFENPDFEKLDPAGEGEEEGAIIPVYSAVSGIAPKAVRRIIVQSLAAATAIDDPLPEPIRKKLHVPPLGESLIRIHRPSEIDDEFLRFRSPAHRRMILQEFFAFQLALRVRRASEETREKPRKIRIDDKIRASVRSILPFKLTGAQKRVLKEIASDLQSTKPMYRLLQGDVGSGKTIVALIAAIVVIENGHQAALLAPTEILAEQHYQRIRQLVDHPGVGHPLRVALLTGSTAAADRKRILADLRRGEIDLILGTHALLEERVVFHSLALAIVDEQHRFGVEQRQKLFRKGELPDILIMTATPIPRSLALTLFGDLELSVIDEMPPGRISVKTVVRGSAQLPKVFKFIGERVDAGEQAYVVYPIIEESETLDLTPLTIGVENVRAQLPGRRIGVIHGRMPSDEKEKVMSAYKSGEIDVLVSTTVIEVGIDIPRATVMVIMDADRFGLSQLHQLRGRVGRGTAKSYCVIVRNETTSEEAKERLRSFETTRDGFEVAQRDLEQRGAGDFLGTRQSGIPRFRFGDILRDHDLMEQARDAAIEVISSEGTPAASKLASRLAGRATDKVMGRD